MEGWTAGPVRTVVENLTITGIRSPDLSTRSELLHRLNYRSRSWNIILLNVVVHIVTTG